MLAGGFAAPFFADTSLARASDYCTSDLACRASIRRMFGASLDSARAIASACNGAAEPLPALIDALCDNDAGTREILAIGSPEQISDLLEQKMRADFRAGHVKRVEGWVLSDTELRLFSIAAAG
jgi:hypothetical protein